MPISATAAYQRLDRFIARYSTDVARLARQVLAVMRHRYPGATAILDRSD